MQLNIERIELLLLVAGVVAMLCRKFRLPYSVGLVLAGATLAYLPFAPEFHLSKELIFVAFLPPLVFEAAFYIQWRELKADLPVVLVLASIGVAMSTALTAAGMHFLAGWEWSAALVFGSLIAATDPVSVIAAFKEAGVHGRLRLLVEAESLFNDGTAAVVFGIALASAMGSALGAVQIASTLLATVGGGVLCGAAVGGAVLLLAGRTEDHLVEITFTTIAAYGSFLLAEHFHFSGVLATLTTGLMLGNIGSLGAISDRGREACLSFWEYAAFVANSLIFLLIGIDSAHQDVASVWFAAAVAIVSVTLGRAVAIYPNCAPFQWSPLRVKVQHQHVLFWGGLRGALALALALGLPPDVPRRGEIVKVAFAVVAFSVLVQGLTMTPLLRRIGEIGAPGRR